MVQGSKAWKDIWGAGQGVGSIASEVHVAGIVEELAQQYKNAQEALRD